MRFHTELERKPPEELWLLVLIGKKGEISDEGQRKRPVPERQFLTTKPHDISPVALFWA